jgi:hypothetical protein
MSNFERVQNVTDITDGSVSTVISSWLADAIILCLGVASEIIPIPTQSSIRWVGCSGKDFAAVELELASTYGADLLLGRLFLRLYSIGLTSTEI